jgi:hypothetical protein
VLFNTGCIHRPADVSRYWSLVHTLENRAKVKYLGKTVKKQNLIHEKIKVKKVKLSL